MGLIGQILGLIFGSGRNALRETAEVFRENAEAGAARGQEAWLAALAQHGTEFARAEKGGFDRFMDGVNRLPRPALALGTLALFISAMGNPEWFAARMAGLALVPEPLWWLLGVVVSFYFGARHQLKAQEFQRELAAMIAPPAGGAGQAGIQAAKAADQEGTDGENPALEAWKQRKAAM